jgi:muramoyltetrapeptide carboxypeptidase
MALARPVRLDAWIDVIAPAGPFDETQFRQSVGALEARGFRLRFRPDILERDRFLAGSDQRRSAELLAAIDAPDSDVIWCARGGYGVTRLLPHIPIERIQRGNKILVGFSDITALHTRWLGAGVPAIHGGMIVRFAKEPADVTERLVSLVRTGAAPAALQGRTMIAGATEGVLAGGNLMVLSALCGTPYQPDFRGKILFLEDIGERPYRIDRMLVQCAQAGMFEGIVGLALGEFTDCEQPDGSATSVGVLEEHLRVLGVPTISGLPCGHGAINQALPVGVRARLDATAGSLEFLEPLHVSR